jgi:anti-sigma-K factor RskA
LPAADFAVMTDRSITPVAMYGVGYHAICRCTMFWDKNTGKAYIMIHHLVPAPDGKNYQLWAMVNGKPVSAGIVNEKIRGRFIEMPNVPETSTAFIVTLENAGGSTTPTESETYLAGKI